MTWGGSTADEQQKDAAGAVEVREGGGVWGWGGGKGEAGVTGKTRPVRRRCGRRGVALVIGW